MRRRDFLAVLSGATVALPFAARGQAERMRHVAILMPYPPSAVEYQAYVKALRQELGRLGWALGRQRSIRRALEHRQSGACASKCSRSPGVEAGRCGSAGSGGRVIPVLMRLTRTVPIIVPGGTSPVESGWVESLARPGGNVTGFSPIELSIIGKQAEVLKKLVPGISRVAAIYNPDNPNAALFVRSFEVLC